MSQVSKALSKIAASEEYTTLVKAIETTNYEAILKSYVEVSRLLEEAKNQILEKIQSLPRAGKEQDLQKFEAAFNSRTSTVLPKWDWLTSQIKEQKVMEGEVFAFGSKGDPLVKTPEGRVVVVKGDNLKEGMKVKFKVLAESAKMDFGRTFELTPEFFYLLFNQDTWLKIRNTLDSIGDRIKNESWNISDDGISELSQWLKELEEIRGLADKLHAEEKENIINRVQTYRKKLLSGYTTKLVFSYISAEEEKEITECCHGDEQQVTRALSAPGLFRQQTYESLRTELLAGDKLEQRCQEMLKELESHVDSMESALKFMELKSRMEESYPLAKTYLVKMEGLFEGISRRARSIAFSLAENSVCSGEEISSAVKEAFSSAALCSELRRSFRRAEECYNLREALAQVRTMLGDQTSLSAESALKPYLNRKISAAFGRRVS